MKTSLDFTKHSVGVLFGRQLHEHKRLQHSCKKHDTRFITMKAIERIMSMANLAFDMSAVRQEGRQDSWHVEDGNQKSI